MLLTVGPDNEPGELSGIPPNARVERTVPHSSVLERGVLLIGHAGHGSLMKALWHGRPMVLVPWGRDQPGVAARAEALGVATVVPREGAARASISTAVNGVLVNEGMREAATAQAARLRASDPPAVAAATETFLSTFIPHLLGR